MDSDDSDLIDKIISPTGTFGTGGQQKVIVQRNSPILFPGGTPLTINATSSLLVPNSVPLAVGSQQLSFAAQSGDGSLAVTATSGTGIDSASVIVLNKDTPLPPGAFPINVMTADPQQQYLHSPNVQKVVLASNPGTGGSSGHGGVQFVPATTMKTLQQKIQNPGFKLQIGNTNIMSLQPKLTGSLNQQQPQGPPPMTMIQPNSLSMSGPADLKRLSSSFKVLKAIAPKPVINSYPSTIIKPTQEGAIQTPSPGASSVCHHVLPFGTTIKVTPGNEQIQLPISKTQQIIQPPSLIQQQAQLQSQQPQLAQMQPVQQPQSPQASAIMKQIRPVSPATMSSQTSAVLSPNQNKVIINKIIYKASESHLGPGPTSGQPRIVAAAPPLSPVSLPDMKRKIIITNSANRKRLASPAQSPSSIPPRTTSIQPTQTHIIVQTTNPHIPLAPALTSPRTTVDNIQNTVHAVISSCSSNNITVTPMAAESSPLQSVLAIQEDTVQSTVEEESKQTEELQEPSEHFSDRDNQSSFEEINKTISQSSSQIDISETECSSTTEKMVISAEDKEDSQENDGNSRDNIEMEILESSQSSVSSGNVDNSGNMEEMDDENETEPIDEQTHEVKEEMHTPKKTPNDQVEDQLKSPRLQKRANSDSQQVSSPIRARRLSEPSKSEEGPKENEDTLPSPKPLAIIKKIRRSMSSVSRKSNRSSKNIHSSLLCNEKLETESDESRSVKTSASSLHTISPPKKEETSESPPAYDHEKLQAAIEIYKKKQSMVKSQRHREKSRSESRSVADREEKEEKDYIEGDFGSTPSDLIKWDDGIGHLRNSNLHFQFNHFGLVEPIEFKEFLKHVNTDVYEHLKDPVTTRVKFQDARKNRKPLNADGLYHCKGCRGRATASDFATPEYCSIACIKKTKNEALLSSIANSKTLQRKGIGSSESPASNSTPLPTSDDDSLGSSLNFANAFREKNIIPPKESVLRTTAQDVQSTTEQSSQSKFTWEVYLSKMQGTASPLNLFRNPYPTEANKFRTGMKLEAIDPENNSLFCVCTIVEIRGYRLKLTFDGYSRDYDFWVNADSLDIFPPGWCKKTGRVLQPPFGYEGNFNWMKYLTEKRAVAANRNLFTHLNTQSTENKFQIGMCLEADDLKKSGKVCVASVTDKIDNRILVHFDGWDERYDYWVDIHSPYIHHIDWHRENGYNITPPPDCNKIDFEWAEYIRLMSLRLGTPVIPANESLFATRQPMDFKPGMKLEVVDRKNQMLIRPATVVATDGYEIKVCFDGWPNFYSFWIEDDSSDIHPMNWCKRTNHPIEFPPDYRPASIKSSCDSPYCLGQGNAKILSKPYHTRHAECPYRTNNWLHEDRKKMRLSHEQIVTKSNQNSQQEALPQEPPVKKIKKELEYPLSASNLHNSPVPIAPPAPVNVQRTTNSTNGSVNIELDPMLKTALPIIVDFGPRLKQSYNLWRSSSRILDRCTEGISKYNRNPLCWSVEDVASYVERFSGCAFIGKQIREEQINGTAFLSLTQDDLIKYLDVKLGPAIKLYNRIIHLRSKVEEHFVKF